MTIADVGLCLSNAVLKDIPRECLEYLYGHVQYMNEKEKVGKLFVLNGIGWGYQEPAVGLIYKHLFSVAPVNYLLVVIPTDNPADITHDAGGWSDNPWKMQRKTTVHIGVDGR